MLVCGLNNYDQLGENSNRKNFSDTPIVCPPIQSKTDPSTLISYSTYSFHTIKITENGHAYTVGDNSDCRISGILPKTALKTDTEIRLRNDENDSVKFESAVCGEFYTLYLVSDGANGKMQLAYSVRNQNNSPIFLNIGDFVPKTLFGGAKIAVAVDANGGMVIITEFDSKSPDAEIETVYLPNKDRVIKLACCDKFIIALGESGHVYECITINDIHPSFVEIPDFKDQNVVDISGSHRHCFVVLDDGTVYGKGSNEYCRLGICEENHKCSKFTRIDLLKDHKIVEAYAGYVHSLFKTSDGKLIGCGCNFCGPLMQKGDPDIDPLCPPTDAQITGPILFCIAGNDTSIIFQSFVPPNTPNQRIHY